MIYLLFLLFSVQPASAKNCPEVFKKYGNELNYQNAFCRIFVDADKTNANSFRNFTFNDEGQIQVFSNFEPTSKPRTNSNSTGARVYYIFPTRIEKTVSTDSENNLKVIHASGVQFNFDKNGKISSPYLKIKVSNEINSKNNGGVEIESYAHGLVFDLGYRQGNTPALNPNAPVTITDKNGKKCKIINKDINNTIKGEVSFKFENNIKLHEFLATKCSGLDLSDFLTSAVKESVQLMVKPSKLGIAPERAPDPNSYDSNRGAKPQSEDAMGDFIQKIDTANSLQK
jgi:hypothetical protein